MVTWKLMTVGSALLALTLSACGGGSSSSGDSAAGGLDCRNIQVIVPYSPGGGSDQQVRRLQSALEDATGKKLNITYRTGGDGSVGWNAMANSDPDGCTIGNVVAPNIINLSDTAGGDVGFDAKEFEYAGWTEYSPNLIGVAKDSKYKTFEDFAAAAKANPGKLTLNGVGSTGQLLFNEMASATGLDLKYVPVSGGVGDMIPQVAGGSVDGLITGASGLDTDQIRPIVLSKPSDKFDLPTYKELGYDGVNLVTSWGIILPPKTPKAIVKAWNGFIQEALEDSDVKKAYAKTAFTVLHQDSPQKARQYLEEQADATRRALSKTSQ